jgi:polar amino acid transport system substrate-binding protein
VKTLNFLLIPFLLSFSLVGAYADTNKAFTWADDEGSPPLIFRDSSGRPAGIFYEIMTEAFHRMHVPLKAKVYPWARAQKRVKDGEADGMVTVMTKERKEFLKGSDPILLAAEQIFVNKNNPRIDKIMAIHSIQELKKFKIVDTLGSGWTKEALQGADISWVPEMDNAFNMLINGRADIFIANGYTGADFIKKKISHNGAYVKGYTSIITNPYPLRTIEFRLLIRKNSPFVSLLGQFNRTISQMKKDGAMEQIIERKGLSNIVENFHKK